MEIVPALIFAGAVNAALLSAVLAFTARREPASAWLSAALALLATAMTAIFITHEANGEAERIAAAFETLAGLASGPVLYHYIRAALGLPIKPRPTLLHFSPAVMALLAAPMIGAGWFEPPPPASICLYQAAYTLAATITFVRRRTAGDRSWHALFWPLAVLSTMGAVHAGQVARLTQTAGGGDANLVPLLGALGAFLMLVLTLLARQVSVKVAARYSRSSVDRATLERIFAALVRALDADNLYRRADLGLGDLTAAAGVPAHHASQALSEIGGLNFAELVARRRVQEAKRLLALPENRTVAVEPIGMEAGFRSRSAFYAAFGAETGVTPAEYRRKSMSSPSGADTETAALGGKAD